MPGAAGSVRILRELLLGEARQDHLSTDWEADSHVRTTDGG